MNSVDPISETKTRNELWYRNNNDASYSYNNVKLSLIINRDQVRSYRPNYIWFYYKH